MSVATLVRPLCVLNTAARHAVAAFDLDRTLAPLTDELFRSYAQDHHPGYLTRALQYSAVSRLLYPLRFVPSFGADKLAQWAYQRWFVNSPRTREILAEYLVQNHGPLIYRRGAEELAWRRANLNTTVLISGGLRDFAEPFLRRLHTERVIINEVFYPMTVTGRSKPALLQTQVFSSNGFFAHAVYTDSMIDLPMLEGFPWREIHVMTHPTIGDEIAARLGHGELAALAQQRGWKTLHKDDPRPELPASVQHYAAEVIRGEGDYPTARTTYYQQLQYELLAQAGLLNRFLGDQADQDPITLTDLLAGVGLYLTEPESVREGLATTLGVNFDGEAFKLYEALVARNTQAPTPLALIGPIQSRSKGSRLAARI